MEKCVKCGIECTREAACYSHVIFQWLCETCNESLDYKFEAFKRAFLQGDSNSGLASCLYTTDGIFPPPWDFTEYPEKTEGWVEFQKEMRKHPEYYLAEKQGCKAALH